MAPTLPGVAAMHSADAVTGWSSGWRVRARSVQLLSPPSPLSPNSLLKRELHRDRMDYRVGGDGVEIEKAISTSTSTKDHHAAKAPPYFLLARSAQNA